MIRISYVLAGNLNLNLNQNRGENINYVRSAKRRMEWDTLLAGYHDLNEEKLFNLSRKLVAAFVVPFLR